MLLGIDEMVEWCNSFILVPKLNDKVRLCLDPARLNQVLIRAVHRGLTLTDIFPKLNNVKYLSLIDASSGYHNLKLGERSHTSQHLCVSLAGVDTKDCYFGQHPRKYISVQD